MYVPSVVMIYKYFTRRKAFAVGVAFMGTGLGIAIKSPLVPLLYLPNGWRGTFLLQGGVILHGLLLAAVMRPLENTRCKASRRCRGQEACDYVHALWKDFKFLVNFRLLKHNGLVYILGASALLSCGHIPPFVYLPRKALALGIDQYHCNVLLLLLGAGNAIGSLFLGWLCDALPKNRRLMLIISVTMAAGSTLLSASATYYRMLVLYALFFGIFTGKSV